LAIARHLPLGGDFRVTGKLAADPALAVVKNELDGSLPTGCRLTEPLKMTSAMDSPRRFFAEDSPITQRTASMTLDLPQPLDPLPRTCCREN